MLVRVRALVLVLVLVLMLPAYAYAAAICASREGRGVRGDFWCLCCVTFGGVWYGCGNVGECPSVEVFSMEVVAPLIAATAVDGEEKRAAAEKSKR